MDEQANVQPPLDEGPQTGETVPPPGGAVPGAEGPGAAEPFPPELQAANASKDDRTMAMIAHLLGLVGFLGPLVLYLVKKDDSSEYVKFHMKQSMWWQIWANIVAMVLGVVSIVLMFVLIGFLTIFLAMAAGVVAWVYAIIGAVQTSGGKDFEYVWVGPWVRRSMM